MSVWLVQKNFHLSRTSKKALFRSLLIGWVSVHNSHFRLLLRNPWPDSLQTWWGYTLGGYLLSLITRWRCDHFQIFYEFLCSFFGKILKNLLRNTRPISSKSCTQEHSWGGQTSQILNSVWNFLNSGWIFLKLAEVWLNISEVGWIYLKLAECFWSWLNLSEVGWIYLKLAEYIWSWLNLSEVWLNISEVGWICLKLAEYFWSWLESLWGLAESFWRLAEYCLNLSEVLLNLFWF